MSLNTPNLSKPLAIVSWILQIVVAFILVQSLFFKFTGNPGSVHLFETLGVEPWGRYAVGIVELIAVVLLLVPRTIPVGALFSAAVIAGAIFSHITKLGISLAETGDPAIDEAVAGSTLFVMAVVVLIASIAVVAIRCRYLPWNRGGSASTAAN